MKVKYNTKGEKKMNNLETTNVFFVIKIRVALISTDTSPSRMFNQDRISNKVLRQKRGGTPLEKKSNK